MAVRVGRQFGVPIALASIAAVLAVMIGDREGRAWMRHRWRAVSQELAPTAPSSSSTVGSGAAPSEPASDSTAPPVAGGSDPSGAVGSASKRSARTGTANGRDVSRTHALGGRLRRSISASPESSASLAALACPAAVPIAPDPGSARVRPPMSLFGEHSPAREWWARVTRFLGMDSVRAALDPSSSPQTSTVAPRPPPANSLASPDGGEPTSGGCLKVVVDEGVAVVVIDGVPRGRTPYAIRVGSGNHTIAARSISASYEPARLAVSIAQGDTARAVFHRATSSLSPTLSPTLSP